MVLSMSSGAALNLCHQHGMDTATAGRLVSSMALAHQTMKTYCVDRLNPKQTRYDHLGVMLGQENVVHMS